MTRHPQVLFLLASLSLSACTNPLLGDWDLIEKDGKSYPLVEVGEAEACTTTTTADLNVRQLSDNTLSGDFYERSSTVCFEQEIEDKIAWDLTVDTVKRDEWVLHFKDVEAEDFSLDCNLEGLTIFCEDDGGVDWVFANPETEE